MAKNSIRDYSATNSANTDIQSIDISEGCSPAGINNAIREVMADLKDVSTGAVALESPAMDSLTVDTTTLVVDAVNNRVGVGTASPALLTHLKSSDNTIFQLESTTPTVYMKMVDSNTTGAGYIGYVTNDMTFWANNAERMRIDGATGNVGIGTSSPTKKVSTSIGLNDTDGYVLEYSGEAKGGILLNPISGEVRMGALNSSGTYFTTLYANNSEAVRIDSSGNLLVGAASFNYAAIGVGLRSSNYSYFTTSNAYPILVNRKSSVGILINFAYEDSSIGTISTNGVSTAYNTTSDYRLKTAVEYDWDATSRLKQLKPVRFNFIADADTTVDGFLAHEVQDIVPEAISGTKDGMRDEEYTVSAATGDIYTPAVEATYDEDGVELTAAVDEVIHSADVERPDELEEGQQWRETTAAVMGTRSVPNYQGIDQSKLVPLLVKTIQELEARITALEAN